MSSPEKSPVRADGAAANAARGDGDPDGHDDSDEPPAGVTLVRRDVILAVGRGPTVAVRGAVVAEEAASKLPLEAVSRDDDDDDSARTDVHVADCNQDDHVQDVFHCIVCVSWVALVYSST